MKILVVIDMQNDFITGSLANKEAEKIIPKIAQMIQDFDGKIIFTRDTHDSRYLESNEGKHLPVEHCMKGTFGHQIHRDLLGWRDVTVVDKKTFGSFELGKAIKECSYGLDRRNMEIHIVGTCTDICVVSNAIILKTEFPEAKIVVHKKMCAGMDKKGHNAAMLVMERCQIDVVD